MKVKDIMVTSVITIRADATLEEVANLMIQHNIGCIPVVNHNNELLGIITETDFMPKERTLPFSTFRLPYLFGKLSTREGIERAYEKAKQARVQDSMAAYVITATEEESVPEVVQKMLDNNVKHIPVVRGKTLVGMLTRHDLLKVLGTAGGKKS